MTEQILMCKAKLHQGNIAEFISPQNSSLTLKEQIVEDRKYGIMIPRNEKYFTFRAMDWQNKWITNKQIIKAITLAWQQAEIEISLDVRKAKDHEEPDFKIYFRKTSDDPELDSNTLQYHYFPIQDVNHPLRGVCVVNTDFHWTSHGKPVPMNEIDPDHYDEGTAVRGATIDFDQVYTHEGPGHGLGLPHSPNAGKAMSNNYRIMAEFFTDEEPLETIPRLVAKYGERPMLSWLRKRWRNWYRVRANKY